MSSSADGLKDDLVLASARATSSYEFGLRLPGGVTPRVSEDGGVALVDADGEAVAVVREGCQLSDTGLTCGDVGLAGWLLWLFVRWR